MGRLLLILLSLTGLTACVTEQTFIDSKKQVRSLEFDKEDAAKTRLILGLSYLENGRFEQAKVNLERAYEYDPKRADVNYSLGYYYQRVGEMVIAERYYKKAVDLEPKNPDTLNNYGTFLCQANQLDKAETYFKKAINISKYTRAAESYENMAICALTNEQFGKAEDYYELSYKHNPSRSNNIVSLAGVKYAKGEFAAALDFYGRFLRLNNQSPRSLLLGFILEDTRGRLSQANKYANQLKSDFPNSLEARLLTTGQIELSEFEVLKRKFLAQLSPNQEAPKIRITRKNANQDNQANTKPGTQSASTSTSFIAAGVLADSKIITSSTELQKELNKKVAMFSAPLTDTEAIEMPQATHSTVAITREQPLPEEHVLVQPVAATQVINDRAETAKQKQYLKVNEKPYSIPKYTVADGENLYRVSVKFNVQMSKLVSWNQLKSEELTTGQELYIANPNPKVSLSEEILLSQVAKQQKVTLSALMRWNELDSDGWLKAGAEVFIVDPEVYFSGVPMLKDSLASSDNGEATDYLVVPKQRVKIPTHKVAANEFLYKISTKYNIKISTLMRWNGLSSDTDIKAGQLLYIANPDIYYTVEQQQTLSQVADKLGVAKATLMSWNRLENDGVIKAGTKLLKVNAERYQ